MHIAQHLLRIHSSLDQIFACLLQTQAMFDIILSNGSALTWVSSATAARKPRVQRRQLHQRESLETVLSHE